MIKRTLNLKAIDISYFLLGPRQVGKSHLIEATLQPHVWIDLLKQGEFLRYNKNPDSLFDEVQSQITKRPMLVIIDEIQRCPELLNAVHRLMFKYEQIQFVLTGSSARKLKHGGANLLAGRAWEARLFPLTSHEIKDFNLLRLLNRGGLPEIYDSADYEEDLSSYVLRP